MVTQGNKNASQKTPYRLPFDLINILGLSIERNFYTPE
jgi:hypothetical protein